MRVSRSDSEVITSSSLVPVLVREDDVRAAQGLAGAVDRGEGRPQLVRDRRDELALQLVEGALLGQVRNA